MPKWKIANVTEGRYNYGSLYLKVIICSLGLFANLLTNMSLIEDCGVKLVKLNVGTHPTIPLQGPHQGIVGFRVKVQAFMHILEIQVLERRRRLRVLFAWGTTFIWRSLQIVFVVHLHGTRQNIVHHHHTDVKPAALDAVKAVELRQQRPWVLI